MSLGILRCRDIDAPAGIPEGLLTEGTENLNSLDVQIPSKCPSRDLNPGLGRERASSLTTRLLGHRMKEKKLLLNVLFCYC